MQAILTPRSPHQRIHSVQPSALSSHCLQPIDLLMHVQYAITYVSRSSDVNLFESGDTPGTSKSTTKKVKLVKSRNNYKTVLHLRVNYQLGHLLHCKISSESLGNF